MINAIIVRRKATGFVIVKKWISDGKPNKNGEAKMASHQVFNYVCEEMNSFDSKNDDSWYVDNGATRHVTNNRSLFKTFEDVKGECKIKSAGKEVLNVIGKGTIVFESKVGSEVHILEIRDVWYVPSISRNLFSVLAAQDKRNDSVFTSTVTSCKLSVNGRVVMVGDRKINGSLYKTNFSPVNQESINKI